jgi:hypothetical protein
MTDTSKLSSRQGNTCLTIGLGCKIAKKNADVVIRWGGQRSFADAIKDWAKEGVNGHEFAFSKWGHVTDSKLTSPWALWRILKPTKDKGGNTTSLLAETTVVAATALPIDIDGGNVSAQSLELALRDLGWESVFYTTWQAREDGLRWRIIVPLSTPHTIEGWTEFYTQKASEFQKALEVHHGSLVTLDIGAGDQKKVQILPHRIPSFPLMPKKKVTAALAKMEKDQWGIPQFAEALVYGTRGAALSHDSTYDVMEKGRRTLSVAAAMTASAAPEAVGADEVGSESPSPAKVRRKAPIVPQEDIYVGKAGSESLGFNTAGNWQKEGLGYRKVSLCAGLDGAEHFVEHGIHAEEKKRHGALCASMWALHRAGVDHNEIGKKVDSMISKSRKADRDYLAKEAGKYLTQIIGMEKDAAKMETAIFAALGRGKVENEHIGTAPKRLFARILSRAKHCYAPGGGQLCQSQLAQCMGLPHEFKSMGVRIVRALLGNCERAGLLIATGEQRARMYRLIQPS